MLRLIRQCVGMVLLLHVMTGILYPLVVTGLAQALFPHRANGSLIFRSGQAVGSELIGQSFSAPKYFWSRLSATSPVPYNAANSNGSNLGPLNPALTENVKKRIAALQAADPTSGRTVPVDLVTSSGSGLDPDISPAAAQYQVPRVAKARHVDEMVVRRLVAEHTQGRQLGVLGEPRVNVLQLNLALDRQAP
jgi:potassium-transporting ATPase KdpC subunit